ncbi:MAG: phosphatase [Thermodesulfobacteriota bacterium]|nr:MAG: phosphatase [Thermodesulfobacteriota bacterium]
MATVKGFRGIRYNPEKIEDFGDVLAPPYDVINAKEQDDLYNKDPHNVIRLILSKGEDDSKYEEAANTFRNWIESDILTNDEEPSIYPYYQEFEDGGNKLTRKGFLAAVKIEDFSTKKILPHERTFPKHKRDRLKLNTACKANMSPVFSVYSDPEIVIEKLLDAKLTDEPIFDVTNDDGVRNKLWRISDPEVLTLIANHLEDKSFLIADGHHRYETAIEYRNIQREANGVTAGDKPYEYVMMFLSNAEDKGLIINPTHRAVKSLGGITLDELLNRLGEEFNIEKLPYEEGISNIGHEEFTILTKDPQFVYRASVKNNDIDSPNRMAVTLLHNNVFNKIIDEDNAGILYTKFLDEAVDLVQNGDYEVAFILPELRASDIFDVVLTGDRMPQKTTYFYPKILSGLVFNPLA